MGNNNQSNNRKISDIKSKYILEKIFNNIQKLKLLKIIKYNKKIQKLLNLNSYDYKEYSIIEIEIIPAENKSGKFINLIDNADKIYYHIYFNNNTKKEIKEYYIKEKDKVKNINIRIDYQVKSFFKLFEHCGCIEIINFKTFYRNNILNMSDIFYNCKYLKEINFSNFNTNNVTNMKYMFYDCSSLKELNLINFNSNNVTYMRSMFSGCLSLKELNLNNFNTINVTDMRSMFYGCSEQFKNKIKAEYKNIKEEAFEIY